MMTNLTYEGIGKYRQINLGDEKMVCLLSGWLYVSPVIQKLIDNAFLTKNNGK